MTILWEFDEKHPKQVSGGMARYEKPAPLLRQRERFAVAKPASKNALPLTHRKQALPTSFAHPQPLPILEHD
jgi:hypothetical protein